MGNEDVGASVKANAKLEALLGAEGKVGAYIDEHGITFGADGRAGAFVSAEVNLSFEAHVFGVQTNVNVTAEAHAGLMAEGEALVTIGFDGRIKFKLGAGLSVGVGASVGVEFDVDASELMAKLGLADLASLVQWVDKFQKDPKATIDQIIDDTKKAAIEQGMELAQEIIAEAAEPIIDGVRDFFHIVESSIDRIAETLPWDSEKTEQYASRSDAGQTSTTVLLPAAAQPPSGNNHGTTPGNAMTTAQWCDLEAQQ